MIRILLAHPSRLVCDSIRSALDKEKEVYVVGCATTVEETYFLLPHGNILLMGADLNGANTFDLLNDIRITHPDKKVLVLGLEESPETILRYIETGACGYILQKESVSELVDKLRAASEEKAIVSPSVAAAMMQRLRRLANLETPVAFMKAHASQLSGLTRREREILQLVSEGCTNQEIAESLFIECGTVKNHVHNILKKLEANSRYEAASLFKMREQPRAQAAMSL